MKYYSHRNILDRTLQSKKSSKSRFVCNECLRLIENELLTQREDAYDKNEQWASSLVGMTRKNIY